MNNQQAYDVLKMNLKGDYNASIAVAALWKKIYGEFPKIGLSGAQAEYADEFMQALPKKEKENEVL